MGRRRFVTDICLSLALGMYWPKSCANSRGSPGFELIVSGFSRLSFGPTCIRAQRAGHTSDDRIPFARVFVDLPAADNPMVDPPMHDDMRARPGPGLLADLLNPASQILKPAGHKILTSNWTSCKQPPQALGHFRNRGGHPHAGPHQFVYWTRERRESVRVPSRELDCDVSLPAWYRSAARLSRNLPHGRGWPGEKFIGMNFGNLGLSVVSALAPAP